MTSPGSRRRDQPQPIPRSIPTSSSPVSLRPYRTRTGTRSIPIRQHRRLHVLWRELPPDFRDHQLSASRMPPVYWPALFFPPNRRNIEWNLLMKHIMYVGSYYYRCCILMLIVGFINSMVRCDYTIPIVIIGMIAYWMFMEKNDSPNYYKFEWPNYYQIQDADDLGDDVVIGYQDDMKHGARLPGSKRLVLADKFWHKNQIFYLRHCISAAELFLLSLIFSIILDVLWISVHGDYLRDYGTLPFFVDFSIVSLVRLHWIALVFTSVQLFLKLFSIYWIVLYIKILCAMLWYLIPAKGVQPVSPLIFEEPAPQPQTVKAVVMPEEPPEPPPPAKRVASPSVADL